MGPPSRPSARGGATSTGLMLLVLDNYDSFTFNLVQYLGELAAEHPIVAEVRVERNDALSPVSYTHLTLPTKRIV